MKTTKTNTKIINVRKTIGKNENTEIWRSEGWLAGWPASDSVISVPIEDWLGNVGGVISKRNKV